MIRPEIISGLFSIVASLFALFGGIIVANINNRKKARLEEIRELKGIVKQLGTEVINYSRVEDSLVGQLKEWTQDSKRAIRAKYSQELFNDENLSLMASSTVKCSQNC